MNSPGPVLPTLCTAAVLCAFTFGCGGGGGGGAGSGMLLPSSEAEVGHVLRRLAYGPTPELFDRVLAQGVDAYIDAQLEPLLINESGNAQMNALLAQIQVPQSEWDSPSFDHLVKYQLVRSIYSERQLQEQLTAFWDVHFNTNWFKLLTVYTDWGTATYFEWRENELFRQGALGQFEDLLLASATSPAMLVYLDSNQNIAGSPNENYARELLELHTLGVDNGYTEVDIEEVARCFTGWTVCQVPPGKVDDPHALCGGQASTRRWAFHFDQAIHDYGAKTIFAGTSYQLDIPARSGPDGILDGYDLLAHLAGLPQTAEFISRKLIRKLISDTPPQDLVDSCTATWINTGGSMKRVVRKILDSQHFRSPATRWNRVETPLESLVSTARALNAITPNLFALTNTRGFLDSSLNQELFKWSNPDGYPAESELQLGTSKLLGRVVFNRTIHASTFADLQYDPRDVLLSRGIPLSDVETIVGFYFRIFFQDNYTTEDWDQAVAFLSTDQYGQLAQLNPIAVDYMDRLRQFVAFVASYPQAFQK